MTQASSRSKDAVTRDHKHNKLKKHKNLEFTTVESRSSGKRKLQKHGDAETHLQPSDLCTRNDKQRGGDIWLMRPPMVV